MGVSAEFEMRNDVSNEIANQSLSAKRARTKLAWRPQFTLDEGLERTIAWYRTLLSQSDGGENGL
jgi:CDP-glucose 4,6-dehydratase